MHKIVTFCFVLVLSCESSSTLTFYNQENQDYWYTSLPDCPCEDPDYEGIVLNDGWAKDKMDISKYHKGAASSYRSYPPIQTREGKSS